MEVPFVSPCREFLIVIESDFPDSEFARKLTNFSVNISDPNASCGDRRIANGRNDL